MSQELVGTVVKHGGEKTIKVRVAYLWKHPMYKKQYKRTKDVLVHTDDPSKYPLKSEVKIRPRRKVSKMKSFEVC